MDDGDQPASRGEERPSARELEERTRVELVLAGCGRGFRFELLAQVERSRELAHRVLASSCHVRGGGFGEPPNEHLLPSNGLRDVDALDQRPCAYEIDV